MSLNYEEVVETFETATEENQIDRLREHQVVNLPGEGELWMTGDLHDHRRNFDKLLRLADLGNNPQRHVVLHEIIHGDYTDPTGGDTSWQTLYKAAQLKCEYPQQVHFLLANHDLAQIHGEGIMKAGASVCEAFTRGINNEFKEHGTAVNVVVTEFLLSLPLAIRCANGIFCAHSLPTDKQIETFDYTVFSRPLSGPDYARKTGPVYQLIWGRHMTGDYVARFADNVGAAVLLTGHQPQENGFSVNGERQLILASDHNLGAFLPVDLSRSYTIEELAQDVKKFVAVE